MAHTGKDTENVNLTLNECMLLFKAVDQQGLKLAREGWRYDDSAVEFFNDLRTKLSDAIFRFRDRGITPRSEHNT